MPSVDDDEICSSAFAKIKELYGSISKTELSSNMLKFDTSLKTLDPGISLESYLDFDNPLDPSANRPSPLDDKLSEIMSKSVLNDPNFYKRVPTNVHRSKRAIKKLREEVRAKTAGKNWFDMKSSELTDNDLIDRELMGMRDVIFGGKIYKRGALKKENQSKFVQVGVWKRGAADYYSKEFSSAKSKKKSLVESLLEDVDFKKQNREKYLEMVRKKSYHVKVGARKGKFVGGKSKRVKKE